MFEFTEPGDALPLLGFSVTESWMDSASSSTSGSTSSSEFESNADFGRTLFSLDCGQWSSEYSESATSSASSTGSSSSSFTTLSGTLTRTISQEFAASSSRSFESGFSTYQEVDGFTTRISSSSYILANTEVGGTIRATTFGTGGASTTTEATTDTGTTLDISGSTAAEGTTSGLAAFNTTTTDTATETIVSYVDSFIETTVLTGTTSTDDTSTVPYWTTETVTTEFEFPVSSFTYEDGTETLTSVITGEITYTFIDLTTIEAELVGDEGCRAIGTRYEPAECHVLFTAGAGGSGVMNFCDVFQSADSLLVNPDFETFSSSTQTNDGDSEHGETYFSYIDATTTAEGVPVTFMGAFSIVVPASLPGYQPYSDLATTAGVYDSYTISVPTSVATDTPEYSSRTAGATFARGSITQVLTLNSEDTLEMGNTVDTTTIFANGGWGFSPGAPSATFEKGIYAITSFYPNGSTSSGLLTVVDAFITSEIDDGVVLGIVPVVAVSFAGTWEGGREKKTAIEIPCDQAKQFIPV